MAYYTAVNLGILFTCLLANVLFIFTLLVSAWRKRCDITGATDQSIYIDWRPIKNLPSFQQPTLEHVGSIMSIIGVFFGICALLFFGAAVLQIGGKILHRRAVFASILLLFILAASTTLVSWLLFSNYLINLSDKESCRSYQNMGYCAVLCVFSSLLFILCAFLHCVGNMKNQYDTQDTKSISKISLISEESDKMPIYIVPLETTLDIHKEPAAVNSRHRRYDTDSEGTLGSARNPMYSDLPALTVAQVNMAESSQNLVFDQSTASSARTTDANNRVYYV